MLRQGIRFLPPVTPSAVVRLKPAADTIRGKSGFGRVWPGMAAHHLPGSVLARVDGSPDRHGRSVSASCGTVHALLASVGDRFASRAFPQDEAPNGRSGSTGVTRRTGSDQLQQASGSIPTGSAADQIRGGSHSGVRLRASGLTSESGDGPLLGGASACRPSAAGSAAATGRLGLNCSV
jgi:hypothetical protein